ncbi:hypothetical protein V6N11_084340 [Hibiscus sabdariffa]|uniref:Uncharacterized protein n=1 Tax=Hibiscus sabdariffa TaxID=183260 RepID=A0ABR2QSP9_9ROSI
MRGGDKLRVLTAVVIPNYSVACAVAYYGALLLAPPRSSSSQNFSKAQAYLCLAGALFLPVCDDRLPPFLGFPLALCNLYGCGASPLFIVLTPLLSTMGVIALFCVIRPSVLHLGFRRKGTGLGFLSHSVCLPAIGAADANLGCLSSCTCLLMRAAAAHAFHYVGVLSQLPALVPRGRASRATVVTIFGPPSVPARWFPFPSLGLCSSWAGLYGLCFHLPSSPTWNRTAPLPFPSKLKLSYPYKFSGRLANTLHCDFSLLLSTSSCAQHLHPSIFLMAEELLAQLGNLRFTTEEQDVVVVTSDSMEVPAEDFACSLVGRVVTQGSVDSNCLIHLFRALGIPEVLVCLRMY